VQEQHKLIRRQAARLVQFYRYPGAKPLKRRQYHLACAASLPRGSRPDPEDIQCQVELSAQQSVDYFTFLAELREDRSVSSQFDELVSDASQSEKELSSGDDS
jgi:hypothetical protein